MNETSGPSKSRQSSYPPEDWKILPLWEVCENPVSGYSPVGKEHPAGKNEVGVLKLSCIKDSRFHPEKNKSVADMKAEGLTTPVKGGTLMISRSNTDELVGAVCYIERDYPNLFLSDLLWQVSAKTGREIDLRWLSYLLSFAPYRAKIISRANGTSGSMKKINKSDFLGIHIVCPQLKEQKKIADTLSTWDTGIDQTRKLIAAKKNHKKALVQQLLEGRKQPQGGANEAQDALPLKALIAPVARPVPKPSEPYLAIGLRSHGKGTFHRRIDEPDKIEMETLFRVEKDDIIVNITFAWEGAIAVADEKDAGGFVSHRFPTFRAKMNVELSFLRQLMLTRRFVWDLGLISPGGAGRNRVLSKNDFLNLKVFAPSQERQRSIGCILSSADQEIELLEKRLAALEKQKRGLMQKLLTGEVRVKE